MAFSLSLPDLLGGDANFDGMVNIGDLGVVGGHYGQSTLYYSQGDLNGDGVVNIGDLGVVGGNYGYGAGGAAIPEPVTLALLCPAMAWLLGRRKR